VLKCKLISRVEGDTMYVECCFWTAEIFI